MDERPLIACLLPVRNGEALLEGWFESVERFADQVVALDDGSTDGTLSLLERHPLAAVIVNPVRETYAGWDDRANRMRLLEAAGRLRPKWIVQLDADERIAAGDAEVLRDFLESAADPTHAYVVQIHRMVDDLDHYDDASLHVGRIFAWEPGQWFPESRLHFVALPTCIPPERWVNTTVRVQHLGALTAHDRADRYRKYRESDPDSEFHPDYRRLLQVNPTRFEWRERGPCLPVVLHGAWHRETTDSATSDVAAPAISVVVISRNDEAMIADAVQAVVDQECAEPFEVIVVASGDDRTASIVREEFPDVRLIELDGVALPGRARNAGLAVARGRYVTFPGSHIRVLPGVLAARLAAHRRGYAMVTGPMYNGTLTWSGWASYFLDHNSVLPERPSEAMRQSPAHCSYSREALVSIGGFPEDLRAGEDTVVNNALWAAGYGAWFASELAAVHHTPCRTPGRLARHHFNRGRGLARVLLRQQQPGIPLLNRRSVYSLAIKLMPGRMVRVHRSVQRWADPELTRRWRWTLPLSAFAVMCSWAGLWVELLRPGRGRLRTLFWKSPNL